jgi:hypothetical protein
MKAKDLAELLLKNPDFDVKGCYVDISKLEHSWSDYHFFDISGIADVGYSDKVIILDCY